MSIPPGKYDIKLRRRSDWSKTFILKSAGSAVNLNGYSVLCQFWTKDRTKKHVDVTTSISDAANGEITLSLTDTQTALLPDTSYYDVRLTTGTTSNYWLYGKVTAEEGYSA
tara:strand:+ start:369 stop:701 length:333 start_codon:yes stop_codon:yes gene_type:complete